MMVWMECPFCARDLVYTYVGYPPERCEYCGRKITPTALALKLQERILALTGVKVSPYITRLYPGHWQRSAGAFSWRMDEERGGLLVGSCMPATKIGRAKELWLIENDVTTIEIGTNDEGWIC